MSDNSNASASPGAIFERPLSKTEYVLQRLRQELEDGSIQPGSQIRQGDISSRYGVGATPVREALRRLEAEGHIDYSPHRGATVNEMPREDLYALYRFRVVAEKLLAELAVERANADAIQSITEKHEALVQAAQNGQDAARLSQMNREFHLAVMRAGAPYIADHVLKPMWKSVLPPSQSQWDSAELVQKALKFHGEIVEAIEQGDGVRAGSLMEEHVNNAYQDGLSRTFEKP